MCCLGLGELSVSKHHYKWAKATVVKMWELNMRLNRQKQA